MSSRRWSLALACVAPFLGTGMALAASPQRGGSKPAAPENKARELVSFLTLHAPGVEEAKGQALAWLKGTGKSDAASLKAFEALWSADQPLLERVVGTLELGEPEAGKLLRSAREQAAPTEVPALLKDAKLPAFLRANLGLAYAKTLSNRKVFEEALEVLRSLKPDQVVDPAAYFFHRAVAEHALLLKDEARTSITAVLEDVTDAPERYKMVSLLMLLDMQSWQEKDLGWIARKMDNIERRLELSRGGPQTQKIQKEVVARLDELIKELENQQGGS